MWDWSSHMHRSEDLVNTLFMTSDVAFPWLNKSRMGMDETNTHYIFRTRWQKYHQQKVQFLLRLLFRWASWYPCSFGSLCFCKCHRLYVNY
jgi:hypothetical protein